MKIIQASTLTPAQKQQFAEILAQATKTDPLYKMDDQQTNPSEGGSTNAGNDDKDMHELVNGTTQDEQSGDASGGRTSAGQDMSESGDAKSASQSQSSSDSSSGAGASSSNAYELSQKSASKSASSSESSMPIFVIIAIIILIAIFLVGYVRDQSDEDYDDY
jgi:cobaltochelatase CobN